MVRLITCRPGHKLQRRVVQHIHPDSVVLARSRCRPESHGAQLGPLPKLQASLSNGGMDDMYDSLWRDAPSNVLPVGFGWAAGGPRLFALYLSMRGPEPSMSELTRRGRRYSMAVGDRVVGFGT